MKVSDGIWKNQTYPSSHDDPSCSVALLLEIESDPTYVKQSIGLQGIEWSKDPPPNLR